MDIRCAIRIVESEGDQPGTPAEAFLKAVWDITDPHPFMRGQRIYGYCVVEVRPDINDKTRGITINDLMSVEAGQQKGHGRDALKMLLELADKHGVTLSLFPKAYAKGPGSEAFPKTKALRDWYRHYGFQSKRGEDYWYRKPGTPIPAPRNPVIQEGRSIKLDNGRRAVENPTRSDITQMLMSVPMLRGLVIGNEAEKRVYVWSGLTMAHDIGANRVFDYLRSEDRYIRDEIGVGFKIGVTPEAIQEDRFWRDLPIHDCGGYYAAFASKAAEMMKLPVFRPVRS